MTPLPIRFMSINDLGHNISVHYTHEKLLFTLHALCLMFNCRHGG